MGTRLLIRKTHPGSAWKQFSDTVCCFIRGVPLEEEKEEEEEQGKVEDEEEEEGAELQPQGSYC